jgi:hypothetical protein
LMRWCWTFLFFLCRAAADSTNEIKIRRISSMADWCLNGLGQTAHVTKRGGGDGWREGTQRASSVCSEMLGATLLVSPRCPARLASGTGRICAVHIGSLILLPRDDIHRIHVMVQDHVLGMQLKGESASQNICRTQGKADRRVETPSDSSAYILRLELLLRQYSHF